MSWLGGSIRACSRTRGCSPPSRLWRHATRCRWTCGRIRRCAPSGSPMTWRPPATSRSPRPSPTRSSTPGPKSVRAQLALRTGRLDITVTDDGVGFGADSPTAPGRAGPDGHAGPIRRIEWNRGGAERAGDGYDGGGHDRGGGVELDANGSPRSASRRPGGPSRLRELELNQSDVTLRFAAIADQVLAQHTRVAPSETGPVSSNGIPVHSRHSASAPGEPSSLGHPLLHPAPAWTSTSDPRRGRPA